MKKYMPFMCLMLAGNKFLTLFSLVCMGGLFVWDILKWMAEGRW